MNSSCIFGFPFVSSNSIGTSSQQLIYLMRHIHCEVFFFISLSLSLAEIHIHMMPIEKNIYIQTTHTHSKKVNWLDWLVKFKMAFINAAALHIFDCQCRPNRVNHIGSILMKYFTLFVEQFVPSSTTYVLLSQSLNRFLFKMHFYL